MAMKLCCRCKKRKKNHEFNFKNKALKKRHRACKTCTREEIRKHYERNQQYYLVKARKRNKQTRENIREYIWNYLLNHPCVDCGEKDPIVLDFDHRRDKIAAVSVLIKRKNSMKCIENEIAKCEIRCANCHRKKTAIDYKWYKEKFAPVA